ncbi:ankyrin repeat domain-containing protein [Novipirellula sp. SH528]|uniref:ankyrin repeat domain-containing protein n=1 Tax=Novipirellula sp. SH528 TaxID=3454466 RepID=UPI003F9F6F35
MNDVQRLAFELQLDELRHLASENHDLAGCMLSACSAHDPAPKTQTAVIQFLIDSGVSVNETDKNGVTPLHRAVRFRSLAAVELLLAAGADVNATDRKSHSTALHRAVTNTGAPSTAGKTDVAILIVQSLLSHGADPTAKNKAGKAPTDYRMGATMSSIFHLKTHAKPRSTQ